MTVVVLALLGGVCCAQNDAGALLKASTDYMSGLGGFRVTTTVTQSMTGGGQPDYLSVSAVRVAAQMPNKLRLSPAEGDAWLVICDGESVWGLLTEQRQYFTSPAGSTLDSVIGSVLESGLLDRVDENADITPIGMLSDPEFAATVAASQGELTVAGKVELDGVECDRIVGVGEEGEAEVIIESGPRPVLRRVAVHYSFEVPAGPDENAGTVELKGEFALGFSDWDTSPAFADAEFTFTVPEGAELVATFDPSRALIDQDAPAFVLPLLAGGSFDLDAVRGKKIVILDFWATWCGPCQRALPIYAQLAEEYADRGVVFVAVNVRETPEEIRAFLEEQGLSCHVALDSEGDVADLYNVSGIPHSVIIGTDGTVASIHIGFSDDLEEVIRAELDAMLEDNGASTGATTDCPVG